MAGIYVHFPFCRKACSYCNFYFTTSVGNKALFLEALLKEIELENNFFKGAAIDTLYFGGGTPSYFSTEELLAITESIKQSFAIEQLKEFTIECNPEDLTKEKLESFKKLRNAGLNRLSIGVQSFNNDDLVYMDRAHNVQRAIDCIQDAKSAGFENITIDLIYGTPTMSHVEWMKNLEQAITLEPQHISAYALTVEPKTTLNNRIQKKKAAIVDETHTAEQFEIMIAYLANYGYHQYEISNFAIPGYEAKHNSSYWKGEPYLGLGPSAHSYDNQLQTRRWNVANIINYAKGILNNNIQRESEILSVAQQVNEKIMTGLRTIWGVNLNQIPQPYRSEVMQGLEQIPSEYWQLSNGILTLTAKGKLFADGISSGLFIIDSE